MAISEIEEIQEFPTTTRSPETQELPPEITKTRKPRTKPKPPPASSSSGCGGFSLLLRRVKKPEPDPLTECVGKTRGLSWATKFSAGNRPTMEDFHTTLRGFMRLSCGEFGGCATPRDSNSNQQPVPIHYFGVFDGHRGDQVGEFCANMLHYMVIEEWEKQSEEAVEWRERWKIAFSKAFERADDAVKDTSSLEPRYTGSTASVVLVTPCRIIASNCGDSRAILCRSKQVIPLTVDHKPHKKEEAKRIKRSGGKIIKRQGLRVEGVLSMTRAIGDHDLKPYVISAPNMTYTPRSDDDECLIMASDGLWDAMSSEKVAEVARKKLLEYRSRLNSGSSPTPAAAVAEELVRGALAKNTKDNVTVIVVDLKPIWRTKQGSTYKQWAMNYIKDITSSRGKYKINVRVIRMWKVPKKDDHTTYVTTDLILMDDKGDKIYAIIKEAFMGKVT